ncbi:MAG: hypothetical protein WDM96_01110 [Lacunisphaera sp.]
MKNEIARLLIEDGKVAEALPWLTAAVDLDPKEPLYHYHLGKLLTEGRDDLIATGQFTRASLDRTMFEAFQKAAALAPDNFGYAYRAAEAYYDLAEPKWMMRSPPGANWKSGPSPASSSRPSACTPRTCCSRWAGATTRARC